MYKKHLKTTILLGLIFLIVYKRNATMGVVTESTSINDNIIDVVNILGGGLNAALLLAETCATESSYGNNIIGGDVGIMQFTTVGFTDTQQRTSAARKQLIKSKWDIDIDNIKLDDLRFSPLKSIIFARLFYLLRSGTIPNSIEGRAAYWKKYYNSSLGAGTVQHYIRAANEYKNQIEKIKGAFK
jgi:hypothetical protein